jgi:hypothetical protein
MRSWHNGMALLSGEFCFNKSRWSPHSRSTYLDRHNRESELPVSTLHHGRCLLDSALALLPKTMMAAGGALSPERVWSAIQGYGQDHSEQKDTTNLLFPLIPMTTVWCTCKLVSPLMPLTCQVIVVSDGSQASQRPHVTGRADTNMWAWCSPSEATAPADGGRQKAPS